MSFESPFPAAMPPAGRAALPKRCAARAASVPAAVGNGPNVLLAADDTEAVRTKSAPRSRRQGGTTLSELSPEVPPATRPEAAESPPQQAHPAPLRPRNGPPHSRPAPQPGSGCVAGPPPAEP